MKLHLPWRRYPPLTPEEEARAAAWHQRVLEELRAREIMATYADLGTLRRMQAEHGDAGTVAYLLGVPVEDVLRVAPPGSPAARKQEDEDGVHAAHCCRRHGCKYGDAGCPVAQGTAAQDYPCELCEGEQ